MTNEELAECFSDIPTLHTARLTMRRLLPSDSEDMYEYSCLTEVCRYLLWSPHTNARQTRDYLEYIQSCYRKGVFYDWAVILNENGKMIGTCGYTDIDVKNNKAEIGYVLNPSYWGKGYATEAVMAAEQFAFNNLELTRLDSRYMIGNQKSLAVMKKCGMKEEGVLRSYLLVKGIYRDIGVCSILKSEFAGGNYCTVEKKKKRFRFF